jgi:hypothetical protein
MKKTILNILALLIIAVVPVAVTAIGVAQSPIEQGVNATCSGSSCPTTGNASGKVNTLVENVINIFSWVIGVISVLVIIYGGFKYITSAGDAGKVTSAKNTILYALVGLVIAALAQIIVLFVLGSVTN